MISIARAMGFLVIALLPYVVYIFGIFFGKKQLLVWQLASTDIPLPKITVVFSAYNEEKNIEKRIKNLKDCNYPSMEIIAVNDCSSDNTFSELKKWLDWSEISYNLIENSARRGVSASYNFAISQATTDIVVVTDADVIFKRDALHLIVKRLISDDKIGAVTGDLQPDGARYASLVMEEQYRSVYGDMCEWESAHDSTMNFNGALIAFRKSAVSIIPRKGADDANIAFSAIRNGYRAVYESDAIVYENIPQSFKVQYKQKIRRAHGILMAMWENKDLLSDNRPFARFFFMRMWMYFLSPILFFIGLILYPPFILLALLSMISSMCRAFVINQFYLIAGLFYRKDTTVWESTSSQQENTP
jgi:poly-beta-1,6-N-acetyl-D-glucosamine synthase